MTLVVVLFETYFNTTFSPSQDLIEPHYTDNGLNCGGLDYQVSQGGKCGVCGDGFGITEPRPHEDGGKYGKGIIASQFQPGQTISTQSQITAHHKGWLEFKLCPLGNDLMTADELQACLDANLLEVSTGGTRYMLGI